MPKPAKSPSTANALPARSTGRACPSLSRGCSRSTVPTALALTVPVSDIGSITKQFTGAAILRLEEDGRLSVSDPITDCDDPSLAIDPVTGELHLVFVGTGLLDLGEKTDPATGFVSLVRLVDARYQRV